MTPLPDRYDARRAAVVDLVASRPPRCFAPTVSVGDPRGRWARFVDEATLPPPRRRRASSLDHALRCDVVASLLGEALPVDLACAQPLTWLARPAAWDDPDCEAAWLAAASTAHAELGVPLSFVVVTRHGWQDPRTGESRAWRRLRAAR